MQIEAPRHVRYEIPAYKVNTFCGFITSVMSMDRKQQYSSKEVHQLDGLIG
jgi:hypothetical protein